MTRLLLARGADPNLGGEVGYHTPEGFDDEAMHVVVESERLSDEGLSTMLHRKLDWTGLDGVRWLLAHGADPNRVTAWGDRALHHALGRDNALPLLEALLDFGADPSLPAPSREGRSAVAMAARVGRADVLELFRRRGFVVDLDGDDAFFAALTRADRAGVDAFVTTEPGIVSRLGAAEPGTVATLAGAGNTAAVALALDLGFPPSDEALELAVWRGRAETVRLLLARGARCRLTRSPWPSVPSPRCPSGRRTNRPRSSTPSDRPGRKHRGKIWLGATHAWRNGHVCRRFVLSRT